MKLNAFYSGSLFHWHLEYEIIGEGSQISTNQKRESTVSWLLIGWNLRPFPDNIVLSYLLESTKQTTERNKTRDVLKWTES